MAIKRFATEKFASLEMNRAGYLKTGMVVSQTPLDNVFTAAAPCENGMWVNANKAMGTIAPVAAVTDVVGIVYTTEKEYTAGQTGLNAHSWYNTTKETVYPRVGILGLGDTFTTNCFCYDDGDFADDAAVVTAVKAAATTPLYLVPVVGAGAPQLVKTVPAEGTYAQVIKLFTVPNARELGIKYNVLRVA